MENEIFHDSEQLSAPLSRRTPCNPSAVPMHTSLVRRIAFAALTACIVTACAPEDEPTRVALTLRYEASWGLSDLDVTLGEAHRQLPAMPRVVVLVRDDQADREITLRVRGLRGAQPVASGSVRVTPILRSEVAVTVSLAQVACGAWCVEGATECRGDAVVRCEQRDEDGCFEWSEPIACSPDAPFCSLGTCASSCTPECVAAEQRCDGSGAVRVCGEGDTDPCADWLAPVACADGEVCVNGTCGRQACRDECPRGAQECRGNGVVTCGDRNDDGCTEWSPQTPCGAGESCSGGRCAPIATCTDECTANTCTGDVYRACGNFDSDPCRELSPGTSCDPADDCLEGACDPVLGCRTAPKVCNTPMEPYCVDASTLRTYDAMGSCVAGGACDYHAHDIACPHCPACDACAGVTCTSPGSPCFAATGTCTGGRCEYAPANGVSCDDMDPCTVRDSCNAGACHGAPMACTTPPAPTCIDASTRRTYTAGGTCTGGACAYPFADATCAYGCTAGACGAAVPAPPSGSSVFSGNYGLVALAVDAAGAPHVVYVSELGELQYKRWDGTAFATVYRNSARPTQPAIALDATGEAHLCFDDQYAHRVAGAWRTEEFTTATSAGCDLIVDRAGVVHVVFVRDVAGHPPELVRARREAGAWRTDVVESAVADDAQPHATLDSAGRLLVAYQGSAQLRLARDLGTSWAVSSIAPGLHVTIARDAAGTPHVAYAGEFASRTLVHARLTGTTWEMDAASPDLGARIDGAALALDPSGRARIAYYDAGTVSLARESGSGWTRSALSDVTNPTGAPAIAVDRGGRVHVVYPSFARGAVLYAVVAP